MTTNSKIEERWDAAYVKVDVTMSYIAIFDTRYK